jgi:DNA binding domain, excisionase family
MEQTDIKQHRPEVKPQHRIGTIVRLDPNGLAFLQDDLSGAKYSFTFDKIVGYSGEPIGELKLSRGVQVRYLLADEQRIGQVELIDHSRDHSLLTVPEVARVLRVSERMVYNMIKRGELQHLKLGRLMRVPKRSLAELMAPLDKP